MPNCIWECWFVLWLQLSFMFCISVCPSVTWWLKNMFWPIVSEQVPHTEPCARCLRGTKDGKKKSYSLFSSKRERSQDEFGRGKSKANHQRRLRKEYAKSQVPNWNMAVTMLLVKSGPAMWLMTESSPNVRTNEKGFLEKQLFKFSSTLSHGHFEECGSMQKKIPWANLPYK